MTPTPIPTVVWATPTPYPTPSELAQFSLGNINTVAQEFAEQSVSTYQMANQGGYIDGLLAILVLMMVLFMLRFLMRQLKDL
jgi:hypothetical protein